MPLKDEDENTPPFFTQHTQQQRVLVVRCGGYGMWCVVHRFLQVDKCSIWCTTSGTVRSGPNVPSGPPGPETETPRPAVRSAGVKAFWVVKSKGNERFCVPDGHTEMSRVVMASRICRNHRRQLPRHVTPTASDSKCSLAALDGPRFAFSGGTINAAWHC